MSLRTNMPAQWRAGLCWDAAVELEFFTVARKGGDKEREREGEGERCMCVCIYIYRV